MRHDALAKTLTGLVKVTLAEARKVMDAHRVARKSGTSGGSATGPVGEVKVEGGTRAKPFAAKARGRGPPAKGHGGFGRAEKPTAVAGDSPSRGPAGSGSSPAARSWSTSIVCHNCLKQGHIAKHCPNASAVELFKEGVRTGDITWHAFPHNAQLEIMGNDMLDAGFELTRRLDATFNATSRNVRN